MKTVNTNKFIRIYNEEGEFYLMVSEDLGTYDTYLTLLDGKWGGLRYGENIKNYLNEFKVAI